MKFFMTISLLLSFSTGFSYTCEELEERRNDDYTLVTKIYKKNIMSQRKKALGVLRTIRRKLLQNDSTLKALANLKKEQAKFAEGVDFIAIRKTPEKEQEISSLMRYSYEAYMFNVQKYLLKSLIKKNFLKKYCWSGFGIFQTFSGSHHPLIFECKEKDYDSIASIDDLATVWQLRFAGTSYGDEYRRSGTKATVQLCYELESKFELHENLAIDMSECITMDLISEQFYLQTDNDVYYHDEPKFQKDISFFFSAPDSYKEYDDSSKYLRGPNSDWRKAANSTDLEELRESSVQYTLPKNCRKEEYLNDHWLDYYPSLNDLFKEL